MRLRYANGRTAEALAGADLTSFRHVAWRLSELVPRGAHGSPGWSIPHPPLIVIGRMDRRGAIGIERQGFGLRAVNGRLHVLVNRVLLTNLAAALRGLAEGAARLNPDRDWPFWEEPEWQGRRGGPPFRWYRIPVDLPEGRVPPPDHPLADGRAVARLLGAINALPQTEHPEQHAIDTLLEPARRAAAAPAGVTAIYPRLIALLKEGEAPVARRAAQGGAVAARPSRVGVLPPSVPASR